jgi:hypothetical protein
MIRKREPVPNTADHPAAQERHEKLIKEGIKKETDRLVGKLEEIVADPTRPEHHTKPASEILEKMRGTGRA